MATSSSFASRGDFSTLYVKRLIGLPGDVVTYRRGAVSINHQALDVKIDSSMVPPKEDAGYSFADEIAGDRARIIKLNAEEPGASVRPQAWLGEYRDNCSVVSTQEWECKVPAGKFLMMGDNRDNSADSRVWGFLDQREVVGKAVKVLINFPTSAVHGCRYRYG